MSKAAEAAGILVPIATDPVNLGDANGAFKRSVGFTTAVSALAPNAVSVAVETGLLASLVLFTLAKSTLDFVIVISPVIPFTV